MCPLLLARRLKGAISEVCHVAPLWENASPSPLLLAMYYFFVFALAGKKTVSARLKAMLQIPCIFFFTSILPFPLPFFQNGTCTRTQNNKTKQQPCKNGEMETGPVSLWSGAEKAWRKRCSALPTRQVCNITFHCFRSVEFPPRAKGWSAWNRCWLPSFKGMVQDFGKSSNVLLP